MVLSHEGLVYLSIRIIERLVVMRETSRPWSLAPHTLFVDDEDVLLAVISGVLDMRIGALLRPRSHALQHLFCGRPASKLVHDDVVVKRDRGHLHASQFVSIVVARSHQYLLLLLLLLSRVYS